MVFWSSSDQPSSPSASCSACSVSLWGRSITARGRSITGANHGGEVVQQGDLLVDQTPQELEPGSFEPDHRLEERKDKVELGVDDLPADPNHRGEKDLLDVHDRAEDVFFLSDNLANVKVWQWNCDWFWRSRLLERWIIVVARHHRLTSAWSSITCRCSWKSRSDQS